MNNIYIELDTKRNYNIYIPLTEESTPEYRQIFRQCIVLKILNRFPILLRFLEKSPVFQELDILRRMHLSCMKILGYSARCSTDLFMNKISGPNSFILFFWVSGAIGRKSSKTDITF